MTPVKGGLMTDKGATIGCYNTRVVNSCCWCSLRNACRHRPLRSYWYRQRTLPLPKAGSLAREYRPNGLTESSSC